MIWCVIIGMFGAFGALCAIWTVLGNYLTKGEMGSVVVHPPAGRAAAAARRLLWLRELGVLRARIMIVTAAAPENEPILPRQFEGVEFLSLEQYMAQLIEEREDFDGI